MCPLHSEHARERERERESLKIALELADTLARRENQYASAMIKKAANVAAAAALFLSFPRLARVHVHRSYMPRQQRESANFHV